MDPILITADRVLVGAELEVKSGCGVLLENGSITAVGELAALKAGYPQLSCVDYGDATILPGLIDSHTHLDWDCNVPDYVNESQGCEARLALIGQRNMELDLRSGVTTGRYMGGHYYLDVNFREWQRSGFVSGPRVFASGIGMRSSAGHGYIGIATDGEANIINTARQNLLRGVDWMKFYSTASHLNAKGFPSSFYTRHETNLIIDMAHRVGVPVTSHCVGGQGMTDAIECGIDCLEHCYFASDEHIDLMLKHGTKVCLTMSEYFTEKVNMPAAMQAKFHKYRHIVHERMEAIIKSGVPFVLGTDGMHGELWREAVYLVEHGGTAQQALRALTVDAAKLLGTDDIGVLAEGKCADVIVVRGDALQDVSALQNVLAVYQKGRLV